MNRAARSVGTVCLAVLFGIAGARAAGEETHRGWEYGVLGGMTLSHKVVTGDDSTFQPGPAAGGHVGRLFGERWAWIADANYASVGTELGLGNARTLTARTGFNLFLSPDRPTRWFFSAGGGWLDVDYAEDDGSDPDFDRAFLSAGVGQRFWIDETTALRWELRGDFTIETDGIEQQDYGQGLFLLGVTWGRKGRGRSAASAFAKMPPVVEDADGDGVPDARDRCPDTATRAKVDRRGCPTEPDADNDGVPDNIDECALTPVDAIVKPNGCAEDQDGDGVPNGVDQCPATEEDAPVDDTGCPIDSDRDGVAEHRDICPSTPFGATVDAVGCHSDSDLDGIADGIDRCPNTPSAARVDARGCPLP